MKFNSGLLGALLCVVASCQEDGLSGSITDSATYYPTMNGFIKEKMDDVYLWSKDISDKNPSMNQNPYNYIVQLRYSEDLWSNVDSLYSAEPGVRADTRGFTDGYGYSLQFYYFDYSVYYAVVNYVYPGTPAENAGLKRGDVIIKLNGAYLDGKNYTRLLTDKSLSISYMDQDDFSVHHLEDAKTVTLSMASVRTVISPILLDTIFQYQGKKVAYMHYTEFVDNQSSSLNELSQWADRVKAAAVDEVVVDLRYNGGGYVSAARHFASLLAPREVLVDEKVMVRENWNDKYNAQKSEEARTERFKPEVLASNLDLSHVTFIVSARTASASEFLISVLEPYMSVDLVGVRTHGKYVASQIYKPSDKTLQNWAFAPIVFSYTNALGETVKGGLSPDKEISELRSKLLPLGDTEELLLAKALGQAVASAVKSDVPDVRHGTPVYQDSGILIYEE